VGIQSGPCPEAKLVWCGTRTCCSIVADNIVLLACLHGLDLGIPIFPQRLDTFVHHSLSCSFQAHHCTSCTVLLAASHSVHLPLPGRAQHSEGPPPHARQGQRRDRPQRVLVTNMTPATLI
jgi:hypothetical protein